MKMLAVLLVSALLVSAQASPDLDKYHEQLKEEFQKTVDAIKEALDKGSVKVLALIDRAYNILKKLENEKILDTVKESLKKLEDQIKRIADILTGRDETNKIAHPRLRRGNGADDSDDTKSLKELLKEIEDRIRKARESLAAKWDELMAKVREGREKRIEMVKEILNDIEKFSEETLRKILDILEPFKVELGKWYNKLEDKVKEVAEKSH